MANVKYIQANPNLPEGAPKDIAQAFEAFYNNELAKLAPDIWDHEQWSQGIQKLIEAKDCFVRAVLP